MSKQNGEQKRHSRDERRSLVEWVTLAVSTAIVLLTAGLILSETMRADGQPAVLVVQAAFEDVRQEGDHFYLPLQVRNEGSSTVADVLLQVRLAPAGGEPQTASITADFLAGGESVSGVAIFARRPTAETITFVASYRQP